MSAFIVGTKCMNMAVEAMFKDNSQYTRTELGKRMVSLNHEAIRQRYGKDVAAPEFVLKPVTCGKVERYKALQCLIYQCSEGDCEQAEIYGMMVRRKAELAAEIVHDLQEYDDADWGE